MKQFVLYFVVFCSSFQLDAQNFRLQQQKASRVKLAYQQDWPALKTELLAQQIDPGHFSLCIRIFKSEQLLEAWVKPAGKSTYQLFKSFPICASSGSLGPKRRQGDGQVPEGLYSISVFNPYSSYYLSLGVSYPNAADRKKGNGNPGGDIMIHGNCVTIGCIPITDPLIKQLYLLAVEARNQGQMQIPVQLYPARLDDRGMEQLQAKYAKDVALVSFWKNLQEAYLYFEKNKKPAVFTVDANGNYVFGK